MVSTPLKSFLDSARIAVIEQFLSPAQCSLATDLLQASAWQRSRVVEHGVGDEKATDFRTSSTLFAHELPSGLQPILAEIQSEINRMLGTTPDRWEGWQANRYQPGQQFKAHLDTGLKTLKENDRQYTVIMTLQGPVAGGSTDFPRLERQIESVTGRCIIWDNLDTDGDPSPDALHAGTAPTQGEKIILVNWIRQYPL